MMKKWLNETYHIVEGKRRMLPEYNQWFDMFQRCFSERSKKVRVSYKYCQMDKEWCSYDSWLEWARCQTGFLQRDSRGNLFQIDKDLLGTGMLYDIESCCFLPKEINVALINNFKGFQSMPNGKFRVVVSCYGVRKSLGCFSKLDDAFSIYKEARETYLKDLAEKWKGSIDARAYNALLNYTVNIED